MPMNAQHPFHPIIYVRGFAGSQGEIEDTVADPYMGLNIGATKSRKLWTGDVQRMYFESPLVRLMRQHGYLDVYSEGKDLIMAEGSGEDIQYRSVVIHRYYDDASEDFGSGKTPPIEHFAKRLSILISRLRAKICANPKNGIQAEDFQVYLVAHSMGGLVVRAFLQNPDFDPDDTARCVDKVFTYATPHNGIDMRVVRNIPGWLSFGDVDNFNRKKMASYLGLDKSDNVSEVKRFPAERIFNLVGTDARDYMAAKGLSTWAVGDESDGLVRIKNATTHGTDSAGKPVTSPRAFVHRSHSGHYGIVNSEEGYQNLTRFLFGKLRVDGIFDIDEITLPIEVQKDLDADQDVKASYQFETSVSIRGCNWQFTRRSVRENSEIFRSYDELFPKMPGSQDRRPDRSKSPHLFSVFLDPEQSVKQSKSASFSVDLTLLVPDYVVDGKLFMKRHYEGGYILREQILIEIIKDDQAPSGFHIKYGYQGTNPGKPGITAEPTKNSTGSLLEISIPVKQTSNPGVTGALRIMASTWS